MRIERRSARGALFTTLGVIAAVGSLIFILAIAAGLR